MTPQPFRVCLVPFPLTPIACLGHFVLCLHGLADGHTTVKYHWRPTMEASITEDAGRYVISLVGKEGIPRIQEVLERSNLERAHVKTLVRFFNFFRNFSSRRYGDRSDVQRFLRYLYPENSSPKTALERTAAAFRKALEENADPFRGEIPVSKEVSAGIELARLVQTYSTVQRSDTCHVTFPICKRDGDVPAEVVDWARVAFKECKAFNLQEEHLVILVGGPAGSGKSTLAITLVDEIQNLIRSLVSRPDFEKLGLNVEYVNMDSAAPTGEAILGREGQDREKLSVMKRPWSVELALEAMERLERAKRRSSVVVADLPGRISAITEIASVLGDLGIIVSRDWSLVHEWQEFFSRMGVVRVAQARSRLPEEGFPSVVTRYQPGKIIAGRISGLDRKVYSWDPFVSALAKTLLFDLLPAFVQSRREKGERMFV